jgi:hypothetical protein
MTETPAPTQTIEGETDYKKLGVLGLRFLQLISISGFVVGFIWGGSDFLSSLLPKDGPITPFSVLLMLYGIIGATVIEVAIRIVQRKK